ncbi:MAG: DUF3429 domain-containing protein [Parvularculaceae bacterium]|nr:DUF3429 domain-containing protein [Parvularculaceae bacterium]
MTETAILDLGRSRSRAVAQGRAAAIPFTRAAALVAYLGAAPLLAAALALVVDREAYGHVATRFLVVYGAALLIFFGGVRWGVAVMKPEGPSLRALAGAVAPFAAAMPLALPGPIDLKLAAIMAFMAALLVDDLNATRRGSGAPAWYLAVRVPLTVLIEVSFLVALAARLGG